MTFLSGDRRLIHGDATPDALAIARAWVFGLWAVMAVLEPMARRGELPVDVRVRLGVLHLVPQGVTDWLATPDGAGLLKVLVVAACAAAALGLVTRVSVVLATVLVILWQTETRAYLGYANHAQVALVFAATILAISPCDRALTLWPRRRDDPGVAACQFPLVAILGLTCLIYLFIGAYRLTHGGPQLFQSTALTEWILRNNLRYPDPGSAPGIAWIANPLTNTLGKAGFLGLTFLEVATPLCLMSWGFRAAWLPAMFLAHMGILVLMRIDFTPQVLCYVFFLDSRHWSPARARSVTSTIYFDGYCGLCNGFVDFVLARDWKRRFRFAPLQGPAATARFGDPANVDPTTILLEVDGTVFERSTAALRILSGLGGAWSLIAVFGLVPRPVRDAVYDWVARHRYGWFGKRETCRLPTAEERGVFLD